MCNKGGNMLLFIVMAIFFGLFVGSFFGLMFTADLYGWKKIVGLVATMVLVGCFISGGFCLEQKGYRDSWNDGLCPNCNTEWEFSNTQQTRNGQTYYFWHCESCGKTIKIGTQF